MKEGLQVQQDQNDLEAQETKAEIKNEENLEDQKTKKIKKNNIENVQIIPSGREDVDVCMIGTGRPFLLAVKDYFSLDFSPINRAIEELNENEEKHLYIFDLNFLGSGFKLFPKLKKAFHDEIEKKQKIYLALVTFENSITEDDVQKFNKNFSKNTIDCVPRGLAFETFEPVLTVNQDTPCRVLPRRTVMCRGKKIYALKLTYVCENLCTLMIWAQSGTYIKEFVTGNFRRTSPSLSSLTKNNCDIIQLNVIAVF
uniref:tRNA pseudouridine(55) synthase n=1 Tax=Dermatophagoides pteronyssinus TaxID=6956 RepID=A0A6P6YDR6_DERPT|nr:putative tRNA pseudouridine synthase Pus10 [Dermatophagoides pteronyssinus]